MTSTEPFKVIIAGGGVSGLALANCLEVAGIDYVLLEAKENVTAFVGAGLCLQAGSAALLDQLGIREQLFSKITPLQYTGMHLPNGDYYSVPQSALPLADARCGFTRGFIERSEILKALHANLPDKSRQSRLLVNKRIEKVDHNSDGVVVHCTDGSTYRGDVIAGADGVKSKVRSEMWRASNEGDGRVPKSEQQPVKATFSCLFGISKPIPEFYPRYFDVIPDKGHSIMWMVNDDKIFWYVCKTLPRPLAPGEQKFTDADMHALANELADFPVQPNGTKKFKDLWDARTTAVYLPTEMGEHKCVAWNRFALLGDAVHKQTISAGQGGNLCMESAAAITNVLRRVLDENPGRKPTMEQLDHAFITQYQNPRAARVSQYVNTVNTHTALICKYSLPLRLMVEYMMPLLPKDGSATFFSDIEVGADMLDFVPPPKAALTGTMPFNKLLGAGQRESLLNRMEWALPLLALFVLSIKKMDPSAAGAELEKQLASGTISWNGGALPIYSSFYKVEPIDKLLQTVTTFCAGWTLGFDKEAYWQVLTFFADYHLIYIIQLIESYRVANVGTLLTFRITWGLLGQLLGIGWAGQLFFFLHYVGSQMDNYKAQDLRTTRLQHVRTILPAMLIACYLPFFMSMAPTVSLANRYWWTWVWQPFPIWVSIIQTVVAGLAFSKCTMNYDRISAPERDLSTIRLTIYGGAAISTAIWLYTLTQAPFNALFEFVPSWNIPSEMWECARNFIAWDHILGMAGAFVWLALLFKDLKQWEKTQASWLRIIASAVALCVVAGPGATIALGWLWREELLASKKMKGALLEGTWEERQKERQAASNGHANGHVSEKV